MQLLTVMTVPNGNTRRLRLESEVILLIPHKNRQVNTDIQELFPVDNNPSGDRYSSK
jgi:hypothetical protein